MNPKPYPNHDVYLRVLRGMAPEDRLQKAFELSELTRMLFKEGLRQRFPAKSEEDLHRIFLERIDQCHNQNY